MSDRRAGPCHLEILPRCSPSCPRCFTPPGSLPAGAQGVALWKAPPPPSRGTGSLCPPLTESGGDAAFSGEGAGWTQGRQQSVTGHYLAGLPGGLRMPKSAQHQAEARLLSPLPWTEKRVSGTRAGRGQDGRGENLLGAVDEDIRGETEACTGARASLNWQSQRWSCAVLGTFIHPTPILHQAIGPPLPL